MPLKTVIFGITYYIITIFLIIGLILLGIINLLRLRSTHCLFRKQESKMKKKIGNFEQCALYALHALYMQMHACVCVTWIFRQVNSLFCMFSKHNSTSSKNAKKKLAQSKQCAKNANCFEEAVANTHNSSRARRCNEVKTYQCSQFCGSFITFTHFHSSWQFWPNLPLLCVHNAFRPIFFYSQLICTFRTFVAFAASRRSKSK